VVFGSDNGAINDCPIHGTDKYPGWQEAYPRLGSNAPFRGVKAQLYEGGIRTPLVVNWRSQLEPGTVDHPVQVTDWMPSFCSLTGAEPGEDPQYDGQDIWSLVTGEETDPEERQLFWNFRGDDWLGIRKGDWKLSAVQQPESGKGKSEIGNKDVLYMITGEEETSRKIELFNIAEDPYEEHECAKDHTDLVKELLALIEKERKLDGSSARPEVTSSNVN
jgi:arylsulfatase A-like enzyme